MFIYNLAEEYYVSSQCLHKRSLGTPCTLLGLPWEKKSRMYPPPSTIVKDVFWSRNCSFSSSWALLCLPRSSQNQNSEELRTNTLRVKLRTWLIADSTVWVQSNDLVAVKCLVRKWMTSAQPFHLWLFYKTPKMQLIMMIYIALRCELGAPQEAKTDESCHEVSNHWNDGTHCKANCKHEGNWGSLSPPPPKQSQAWLACQLPAGFCALEGVP